MTLSERLKRIQQIDHSLLSLSFGLAVASWIIPQRMALLNHAEQSQHYKVVARSIHQGDLLSVTDGGKEEIVKLCGIDTPEKDSAPGIVSRDHLRNLIAKSQGHIILVETEVDLEGRTLAEAFIPTGNGEEEIYLNAQMVADGMAYSNPQSVSRCSNSSVTVAAEAEAKSAAIGVWANLATQKL